MTKQPWFPTINYDECDGCKGMYKCVNFCSHGVLEVRGNKASVKDPLSCIYGCSACANLCPNDAIIFPSRESHYSSINKEKLLHKVVCKGCEKEFLTNRETEYCFDCEGKLKVKK